MRRETKPGVKVAMAGTACLAALACAIGLAAWLAGRTPAQGGPSDAPAQEEAAERHPEGNGGGVGAAPSPATPRAAATDAAAAGSDGTSSPNAARPDEGPGAQEDATVASGARAWAEGIEGGENLIGYTDGQIEGLRSELEAYFYVRGYEDLSGRLECPRAPEVGQRWSVVWFRVSNTREYATAQMDLASGEWRVLATGAGVEGVSDADAVVTTSDAGQVEVYDLGSLRALLGEQAGAALPGQYDAWSRETGTRDGIPFLPVDSVAQADGGVSLTIVYGAMPNSTSAPDYQVAASWDAQSATWTFERQPREES